MPESDDHRLLAEFVRDRSEIAFTELVRRYAGLVHSTAFRFCGNPHHAEEITQAVFAILARKAESLSSRVVVSGWLYQTARLTAANFVKGEMRRRRREQEAVMQSNLLETGSTDWGKIAPLLDDAMGALGETDRNAVLLRYFENRTSSEIGVALRMNEETARKRVNRALEKLRQFFVKRGVTVSSAALSGTISANSVQPISAFMVKSISAVAVAKGVTASTSTLTLIKGALKIMAWTKAKTAMVVGVGILLVAGTITEGVIKKVEARNYIVAHEPWSDLGAATPKAAVQTLAWAATNGKSDRVEALMQWEETGSYDNSGSAPAHRLALETDLIPAIQRMESFRIVSVDTTSQPDEAMVTIEKTFKKIPNVPDTFPYSVTLKLHRVGNQWRVIGNIKYQDNKASTLTLPFIGSF